MMTGQREAASDRAAIERLAIGLGWMSIGLGLAEIAAPGRLARLIGIRDSEAARNVLRAYGAREIAQGVGILRTSPDPAWVWTRVGGDVLDIATVTKAMDGQPADRARAIRAIGALAGVTALDAYCAAQLSRERSRERRFGPGGFRQAESSHARNAVHVRKSFTISRQPDVVYGFWRRLENLPRFMRHLESVEVIDERRSRWRARGPAGFSVEWDAEIVEEKPNERLSWTSLEGATVPNRGTVRFNPAPGARGTEVHVELEYSVPGGRVTAMLAKLFGEEPEQQISDDLRRLKQLLEAGEIAVSEGSVSFRQPAQPAPDPLRAEVEREGVRR